MAQAAFFKPCTSETAVQELQTLAESGILVLASHVQTFKKCVDTVVSSGGVIVQARDKRFCNAGVEFDLQTLKPTYRLMWQSVGASNALAVAEGLGFDPLVIREARKVQYIDKTLLY